MLLVARMSPVAGIVPPWANWKMMGPVTCASWGEVEGLMLRLAKLKSTYVGLGSSIPCQAFVDGVLIWAGEIVAATPFTTAEATCPVGSGLGVVELPLRISAELP